MAMEVSCLMGVDEDEKEADSEINALSMLQNPVRMAQESTSCTDSFGRPSLKQNCVLDVLSSTDILSPVGLGNGPTLHQATQAHELNSVSSEKEEEKSITLLKTVQDIDSAGIWRFDAESPENSVDDFTSANDLNWDPHKEFMQFLWDNQSNSPSEEPNDETVPAKNQRRRKRKMDMVVMVDPSEDLYPNLRPKSPEESSADDDQDASLFRNLGKQNFPSPHTSPTQTKYPNGTTKTFNEIIYKTKAKNSHENSVHHTFSPLKGQLLVNSHTEGRSQGYPCSKCDLVFKKECRLLRHMETHFDPPRNPQKAFICRECGKSFKQSGALIDHMSTHKRKKSRLPKIKTMSIRKKEEKGIKKYFCPQCPFVTNCANTFVQHAKTHEKDKKVFRCLKCSFMSQNENDLRRHYLMNHNPTPERKRTQNDSDVFPCSMCSYKAFGKHVFENHLMLRHHMTFEEFKAAEKEEGTQLTKEHKLSPKVKESELVSKISIKNQISSEREFLSDESSGISDLIKNSKMKRGSKSQLTESKLDKSINVLLSRQSYEKNQVGLKKESNNCSKTAQDSSIHLDDYHKSPEKMEVKVEGHSSPLNGPNSSFDQTIKKTLSKRKMSTPYRNTSDQDSCFILPKPLLSPRKTTLEEVAESDEKEMFQVSDSEANGNHIDSELKSEKKHLIYTYSRRMSMRGALQASKKLFEKIKTEEQDQIDLEIKEECIETEVFPFESHQIPLGESPTDDLSELETEPKNCPYCPAIFESGVGLSNHVRGHLHRVGLSYDARHVVPPEQVMKAYEDKRPRIRRRLSSLRRLKQGTEALKEESDSETVKGDHPCPLCGDSFDNRTGQSNHIRGHLKKIGRNYYAKTKTPLAFLRELMRDKKECQRAFQILGRRNRFHYGASLKQPNASRFLSAQTGFPKNHSVQSVCTDAKPTMSSFSVSESESENGQLEKSDVKSSLTDTTALIGILKRRKCHEETKQKGPSQTTRNGLTVSPNSEQSSGSRDATSLPNSASEKGEFNRKMCIHCNATFHSGVSLSNHLRAYAKRKRDALLEGLTSIQCKAVRQRSRPGLKKKTLPVSQSPEEMYRLNCRFCDLVFQGPLSVQEDWIKHLQRHIMNSGVPHTGLGMAEVTLSASNGPAIKTDQDSSPTGTNSSS